MMNLDPTLSFDCEELHFELFNSDALVTLKTELVSYLIIYQMFA